MNELTSRYAQALFSLKRDSNQLLETQLEIFFGAPEIIEEIVFYFYFNHVCSD